MMPSALAAVIIAFCEVKAKTDLDQPPKHACINFMWNCAVDKGGESTDFQVLVCKDRWRKDAPRIIKNYAEFEK